MSIMDATKGLAVVTGSTGGIGKAIALDLARHGYHVVINGRSQGTVDSAVHEALQAVPPGGNTKIFGVPGDLGTEEGATKFISDVDSLCSGEGLSVDVLVNNMGIFEVANFFDIPDSLWHKYMEVNFFSTLRVSRHWLPGMISRNKGHIVMISSEAGMRIIPDMMHYSITKQMQIGLSRGLAQLTRGTRVTVNTVLPGPTWTEGVQAYIEKLAKSQNISVEAATTSYFQQREPTSLIQRFIDPKEVAATVVFLTSEGAAAINGASVRCDGGLLAYI